MIEIINCYSNLPKPETNLIGKHGQSFLIKVGENQILVDTGADGPTLLHNMVLLGINPNEITHLLLTHGHYDHTGGLPDFLDARTTAKPLPVYAHPDVREIKRMKIFFINKPLGFPKLTEEQEKKIRFVFSKDSVSINSHVKTTGEITERPERDGMEPVAKHMVNGKLEPDPMWDDISIIVEASEGNVIITGCAHAGILNILRKVKEISDRPVLSIIGGTHMVRYSTTEVEETGKKLIEKYDDPTLYLNHCTDKLPVRVLPQTKTIDILKNKFGSDKIKTCYVGTKITYE